MSQNRSVRSRLKTLQKRSRSTEGATAENIRALISALDKAAKRGIIHRNAANRRKARLNKLIGGAAPREK